MAVQFINFEGYSLYFIYNFKLIIATEHLSVSIMRNKGIVGEAWCQASAAAVLTFCVSILRHLFPMNGGSPVSLCQGNYILPAIAVEPSEEGV